MKFIGRRISRNSWLFSEHVASEEPMGCGGCLASLVVIGIVTALPLLAFIFALWSIMFLIPAMFMLNLSIWALVASFYFKKAQKPLLALSIVAPIYLLLDLNFVWTSGLFYKGVSTSAAFMDVLVYLNCVAMGVSAYLLVSSSLTDRNDTVGYRIGIPAISFLLAFATVMSYQLFVRDNMYVAAKEIELQKQQPKVVDDEETRVNTEPSVDTTQ